MRTTVDIPDDRYSQLKAEAAIDRTSVKSLIEEGVDLVLRHKEIHRAERDRVKPRWPVIHGGNAEVLARLDNDALFDLEDEA